MGKTRMPRNAGYGDGDGGAYTVRVPLWPHLVTPLAGVGLWSGVAGGHLWWADTPGAAGFAAAGLTLAGTALTALTWRAAAARGVVKRYVATLAAGGGALWTTGAMVAGPWSRPWLDAWVLGTVTASVAMSTVRVLRDGRPTGEQTGGGGLFEAVKSLRGAKVGQASVNGARASAPVVLEEGTAVSELASDREALASVLDVRTSAVRVLPDPDSARRGTVVVVPVDQLAAVRYWEGPSAPGASIADAPVRLGVMEDGEPLDLWLPGDHAKARNSTHLGVVGMSGAGKTELLLNLCADVLTRSDTYLVVTDARKGEQLPEWLRIAAHQAHLNQQAAEDYIEDLPNVIADRAKLLGRSGHKQWVKGCGLPFMVVVCFEAARLVAGNGTFVDVAESARSVGIALVVELQRATYDRIPTSARSNISAWICLGVQGEDDADAALSDTTLAAGAAPWEWRNEKPGYLYAELPGVPRDRWAMPGRAFIARSERDRAAAINPYRSVVTDLPAATGPAPAADPEEAATPPEPPNAAINPAEPPDDVDPAQPIEVPPGIRRIALGELRKPPMETEEARGYLRQYIHDLADAGADVVRPGELSDVIEATGRGGDWVRKELGRLCDGTDAILRHTSRGVYRIRIPEPV